jgi:hypothetical protein
MELYLLSHILSEGVVLVTEATLHFYPLQFGNNDLSLNVRHSYMVSKDFIFGFNLVICNL